MKFITLGQAAQYALAQQQLEEHRRRHFANNHFRKKLYLAGSLRNDTMPEVRDGITENCNVDMFMDWYAAGPQADDYWKTYWQEQAVSYKEALTKPNSMNVFNFDKKHMDQSDIMVLVAPAGKSAHLELGYFVGQGKTAIYYFPSDEDVRWDVMLNFATEVVVGEQELYTAIKKYGG